MAAGHIHLKGNTVLSSHTGWDGLKARPLPEMGRPKALPYEIVTQKKGPAKFTGPFKF